MPSACLSSSLPNPPIFYPRCCFCCNPSFFPRTSSLRTPLFFESHKGNIPLLQSISLFHGQPPSKSLQVLAFNRNSKVPSMRKVELVDELLEDTRFSQMQEDYDSRLFEKTAEIQESSALNKEFEVKENVDLLGLSYSEKAPEELDIYSNHGATSNLDAANAVKKFGGIPNEDQFTRSLHLKDRIFMPSGTRRSRFNILDLVKKVISLPDEERSKVLDLFVIDNTQLTVSEYNDILLALLRAGEHESAEVLFSEFSSRGVSPDVWTFSIMIQCFCKKNDPDKAKEVLDAMLQIGLHPDIYTFTGLICCLAKRGRLKKVYDVFDIMQRVGCEPTIRNYNSLIYGLCYVGKVEEALQLFDKIKKSVNGPDIYTFTFIMDGFCKIGRTDEARKLLREALKMGLTPTIATYNCLFNGYCKERRALEALYLLKEMKRKDFEPDFISYNTLLQGLLKCGKIKAAFGTYKNMKEAGFQVDDRSMNSLIRGLCRQSFINGEHLEEAKELFHEISDTGFGPSPYTYCLMVQTLAERGEINAAMSYLKEKTEDRYAPRMLTYNVVLRVLCGEGRVNDALAVLVIMIERDTLPSRFSLSVLIEKFNKQERLLDSFAVYSVAIKRGVSTYCKPRRDWIYENKLSYTCH